MENALVRISGLFGLAPPCFAVAALLLVACLFSPPQAVIAGGNLSDRMMSMPPEQLYAIARSGKYNMADRMNAYSNLEDRATSGPGHPKSNFLIGSLLADNIFNDAGMPIPRAKRSAKPNYASALPFWRQAAQDGSARAEIKLGDLNAGDNLGGPGLVRAARLWLAAGEKGNRGAIMRIRSHLSQLRAANPGSALYERTLKLLAAAHDVAAMVSLGGIYIADRNYGLALATLKPAADAGSTDARVLVEGIEHREARIARAERPRAKVMRRDQAQAAQEPQSQKRFADGPAVATRENSPVKQLPARPASPMAPPGVTEPLAAVRKQTMACPLRHLGWPGLRFHWGLFGWLDYRLGGREE